MWLKRQMQRHNSPNYFYIGCLLIILLQQLVAVGAIAANNDINMMKKQKQQSQQQNKKPNIVIILIDDMGINDVSFHGSNQVLTPNIDALAYNGILLNRHYVPNLCTPSRATLLTGKYPIHTGTQHHVIINDEPWGLPLQLRLMPEIFRDAGYSTQLVGKWHLGFYRQEHTPTLRGFDHHFGYYSGYIDYYDHSMFMLDRNYSRGLDFRRDLNPWPAANGTYATDVFTDEAVRIIDEHDSSKPLFLVMSHLAVHTGNEDNPMQAPPEEIQKFGYINDPKRRTYAGMISRLDISVGKTIHALASRGMLDNTVVLLYSDNGAPTVGIHSNAGSNYPFRGQKESPWEGGIRSAGLLWSPLLQQRSYVSQQAIHAVDWFPTLATAAGIKLSTDLQLDGVDLWDTLSKNSDPQPRRLLHVLDNINGISSYMRGSLKYINGSSFQGKYDNWLGDLQPNEIDPRSELYEQLVLSSEVQQVLGPYSSNLSITQMQKMRTEATIQCPPNASFDDTLDLYRCEPLLEPCYFDIEADPCERHNLAKINPLQIIFLQQDIEQYLLNTGESARVPVHDERCDPALHGGRWEWWADGASVNIKPFTLLLILAITLAISSGAKISALFL